MDLNESERIWLRVKFGKDRKKNVILQKFWDTLNTSNFEVGNII